ncbi:type I glyceraldehyde-3-phosphate dehydrogenase [Candidatus Azambacteria bacterium RIFCSPHIGHO2_01_FULL_40_24]|uniref:Type I glyceraldehyde-3-phosphate dehydrogenase n=1 Tax=Candidatus Azambacteria bacterium RIFCSPHIGHO2_01_FULL_40_24 TaxID=1797301 RepID=A0A1F5B4D3_9BACT|nr:MAG: type I glyceraldehyde-3-phosphate dehydrogenase [Candidatus Azambacteria bacterium RIFCSPHIGHO2_01_FULL_40_24]
MKKTKIAINGFGRIGRVFFRYAFGHPDLEFVVINDLGAPENMAYLLKYDTVYGPYDKSVEIKNGNLIVDGKEIKVLQEKDILKLPWKDLNIDIVVESTGVFESRDKATPHLEAGAKRVVITAPAKDDTTPTATPNVGEEFLKLDKITSNASCTTNAVTPVMAVMSANPGVQKAILNTIHAYTASQGLVDGPDKKDDFRRTRAAALNIVPSTTGAAIASTKAMPSLVDKFDGISLRVPVICGSIMDFTFIAGRQTSAEEINDIFKKAAQEKQWQGILSVSQEPLVSSDIIRNPHGSIVDLAMTRVVDGNLVKVMAWYDNEWGYVSMLLKHVLTVKNLL